MSERYWDAFDKHIYCVACNMIRLVIESKYHIWLILNYLQNLWIYCLLMFSRKRFYHSIVNRQSLVNEATWSKMPFYLLFLFPFTSFPILCLVDAVTVLDNFLSTESRSVTLSDPSLFTLEMIDSSLLDAWHFSHRRLLFYFRLESYEV